MGGRRLAIIAFALARATMGSSQDDAEDTWKTLWWLPKLGESAVAGTQVALTEPEPHLIFFPLGDPPKWGWPLVVFLHGQGESAPAPLGGVALQGPPQTAGRDPEALDFAVLSPQKPRDAEFYDADVGAWIVDLIDAYVEGEIPVDEARIYLTGISQGGIGTWNLAAQYPSKFAAIAPVAGGLRRPMKRGASVLRQTPIWAFHAANDAVLPVHMSDQSVKACAAESRPTKAGPVKYDRPGEVAGADPAWRAAGIPDMPGHGGASPRCSSGFFFFCGDRLFYA